MAGNPSVYGWLYASFALSRSAIASSRSPRRYRALPRSSENPPNATRFPRRWLQSIATLSAAIARSGSLTCSIVRHQLGRTPKSPSSAPCANARSASSLTLACGCSPDCAHSNASWTSRYRSIRVRPDASLCSDPLEPLEFHLSGLRVVARGGEVAAVELQEQVILGFVELRDPVSERFARAGVVAAVEKEIAEP